MEWFCVLIGFVIHCAGYAQNVQLFDALHPGAGLLSRNYISSTAAYIHPASLAFYHTMEVRVSAQRPFLVPGISSANATLRFRMNRQMGSCFGFGRLANDYFSRLALFGGVGKRLGSATALGINLAVEHSRARGWPGQVNPQGSVSFQWSPANFSMGVWIDLGSPRSNFTNKHFHQLGLGVGKDWSDDLYTDLIVFCVPSNQFAAIAGFRYRALSAFVVGLRVSSLPFHYSFETGWSFDGWTVATLASFHPAIGWSPGISLCYIPGRKTDEP